MHSANVTALARRYASRGVGAALVLGAVLVLVQALGAGAWEALRYDRQAILAGEAWRLLTAHLIHADATHLAWNLAGLALVAWLFGREYSARAWLAIFVASTAAVDAGFLVFEPQLQWYVGFSGVLHGLMTAGLVAALARERDPAVVFVALLFAGKLAWEHFAGPLPFTSQTLAVPVIHASHTYGALGGFAAAIALRFGRRTASL